MLFAEPGHPYDDPDHPGQWAWRVGYFEVLYTPTIKTLSLSRGPKYSSRGGQRSCSLCHGSGYLPWWERTNQTSAADTSVPCPTCPAHRTLLTDVPLWPVRSIERMCHPYRMSRARPRTPGNHPGPWDNPAPGPEDGYSDEPPF